MSSTAAPSPTRAALIEAGIKLFSSNGFDGATVRDITRIARANLGAVTYHFGSKEELYNAVVESTVSPLAQLLVSAAVGPGAPLDRAEAVVRAHFEHLCAHPELPRLVMRGMLDSGMPPPAALRYLQQMLGALVALIRQGQADGTIRDGDPTIMAVGLVSQSLHLTIMRRPLQQIGGVDLDDAAVRASVGNSLARAVRGAIASGGPEDA